MFETHEHKKGLKLAEQILKKSPKHGETLALKGLFLANLGKVEEGYTCVKEGLKYNINSGISWHIYGLVYRADKKYEDAIRCYMQSLKRDPDNLQIHRDLAHLQTHTRNFNDKLIDSRTRVVELGGKTTVNLLGLSMAYQLNGKYLESADVIDQALSSLDGEGGGNKAANDTTEKRVERSELLLYKILMLEKAGEYEEAIENIEKRKKDILDYTASAEIEGRIYEKMGNNEAAKGVYVGLVERNSDNEEYLKGYLRSLSLWKDEAEASPEPGMVQALRDLLEKYPRSNTIQKWILQVTFGEEFSKEAEKYLREQIDKGIPSLFKNLKGIIMDKNKDETQKGKKLREIVESINKSLLETGKYPGITEQANEKARQWSEYFLAQYYDYLGMHKESLDIIEKTEADQDDKAEWQVLKAKVLKHQGDLVGAKDAMNVARVDQKADRFLNTKTVKYLLRCGDVKEAEKTIQLFIRDDAVHKKQELVDMQVVWYFLEKARAFRNKHKFPRALVHYNQVIAAHNEFYDDQLDFHAYCLRKSTLKPYLNLLSWEDSMYDSSKSYIEAVGGFLGGLVYLHDRCFKAKHITTSNTPAVTPTTTTTTTSSSSSSSVPASEDEVALSLPYAKSSSPLDFAAPILSTISKLNLKTPKLWLSSFAVYFRTGKYSDALQCLFNAASSSNLFDSDSRDYFAVFASLFALSLVLDLSDAQYSAQLDKILSTLNANKLSATFAKTDFATCYPAPADAQKLDQLLDFLTSSPLSSSISTSTSLQLNYYSAVLDSLKALTSSSSSSLVPVHLDSLYSRILSVFSKNIIPLLSSQNSTSRLELSDILSIKDSLYLAIELCKLDTKHINTSKDNNKKVLENLNVVLADLQALYTSFISKATELFPRATTLTSN